MTAEERARELIREAQLIDTPARKEDFKAIIARAVGKDPYYYQSYVLLGFFYFKERDWEKALSNLEKGVQIEPMLEHDDKLAKKVYFALGKLYQTLDNREKSLHSFKTFIGLFPGSEACEKLSETIFSKLEKRKEWLALFKKGFSYLEKKNYGEALKHFEQSLELNGTFAWTYYYMGRSLISLGTYRRGIELFEKAWECENHFIFYYGLLDVYDVQKHSDEFRSYLKEVVALNPYSPLWILHKYREFLGQNDLEKAEKLLRELFFVEARDEFVKKAKILLKDLKNLRTPGKKADDSLSGESGKREDRTLEEEESADRILKEAYEEAEKILSEARSASDSLINEARARLDQSKKTIDEAKSKTSTLVDNARKRMDEERETMRKRLEKEKADILQSAQEKAREIIAAACRLCESVQKNLSEGIAEKTGVIVASIKELADSETARCKIAFLSQGGGVEVASPLPGTDTSDSVPGRTFTHIQVSLTPDLHLQDSSLKAQDTMNMEQILDM